MTVCRRSLQLPFRATDLFDLAADVERYPEFVKWVLSLQVLSEVDEGNAWLARAEAQVGFRGFSERFTTDIVADREHLTIDVSLVRGPFKRLKNRWKFVPEPQGSSVDFIVDFEFRNFILQTLAVANQELAVKSIIQSFISEAERRYEPVSAQA